MSFETLQNRTIGIISVDNEVGVDEYGNQVKTDSEPVEAQAKRKRNTADEDTLDRDQQIQSFTYFLSPSAVIKGRDKIVDGDLLLEVVGEPEVIENMLGPHHIEVKAEYTEG